MTEWQFREAREAAALDRFWDRVITSDASAASTAREIAPEDAATIRAFHDLAQQPPDPAFLSRLEDHLMLGQRPMSSATGNLALSPSTSGRFPAPAPRPSAPAASPYRVRGALQLVAVAAVALIVLGLTFVSQRRQEPASPPLHLSALTASSTPEIETSETLLVVPLADAMEPSIDGVSGDRVTSWNLFTVEVAPETSAIWDAKHAICCPGPRFEYVLAGTYRVRADEPMQIVRASNPDIREAVPAGTEVTLGPGDARITQNTVAFEATTEDLPLQLLLGYLIIDKPWAEPVPLGWTTPSGAWESVDDPASSWTKIPADLGAFQLRLQRVDLAPDAAYTLPASAIGQLAVSIDAAASLAKTGDSAVRNRSEDPLTAYVLALEPREP